MNKKQSLATISFGIVLIATLVGCIKDEIDLRNLSTNWTPEVGIPLINSEVTTAEILTQANKNKNILVANDGFLSLVYEGALFSKTAESVFLPNQVLDSSAVVLDAPTTAAINALPVGTTTSFSFTSTLKLNVIDTDPTQTSPIVLDNILYRTGEIFIRTTNNTNQKLKVRVEYPNITKAGIPLFGETTLNAKTSGLAILSGLLLDLAGYEIDLTQSGFSSTDYFKAIYTFTFEKTASIANVNDFIKCQPTIRNQKFRRIVGNLGQRSLSPTADTVNVGIFKNAIGGDFFIKNPTIELQITNSFGIPVNINLASLTGVDKAINAFYPVNIPAGVQNINLTGPAYTAGSLNTIEEITQIFLIDSANSGNSNNPGNIKNILNKKPKQFAYNVSSQTNPTPLTPPNKNVVFNDSKFAVDFKLTLPFEGFAKNFTFTDTAAFSVNEIPAEFQSLTVRTFFKNGFPLDVFSQVYFLDSNNKTIDSLITDIAKTQILKSALTDGSGKVVTPITLAADYVINAARAQKWKTARKAVVKASCNSLNAPNQNIKLFDSYKFGFKLGIIAKGNITLKN